MADGTIGLPADGPGKKLDTEQLSVGGNTVQRERMQIAGAADTEVARIVSDDPSPTDYGLVVRPLPSISSNAVLSTVSSSNLAAGASVHLDAATIPAATTGKLLQITVASSLPAKWVIKTRDGAVEVIIATIFTSGVTGGRPTDIWGASSKEMVSLAGAGVDENFRVTATNLDKFQAADVYSTIEWDEI